MENAVAATMAITTAVPAPLPAILEPEPKVLPGFNSNEGTAPQSVGFLA